MGTNTRWKITKSVVINFIIKNNIGRKRDNNTKFKARKEIHLGNNSKEKGFFWHVLVEDEPTKHVEIP